MTYYKKSLQGIPSECQTVWTRSGPAGCVCGRGERGQGQGLGVQGWREEAFVYFGHISSFYLLFKENKALQFM